MDALTAFYLSLVGVGVIYAIFIMVSGGLHDFASSIHIPLIGMHDAPTLDHGDLRLPSLSPVTIASFVVAFGAAGIVATQAFNISGMASVLWAAGGAFVIAVLSHFAFFYLFIAPQGSSEVTQRDIVGAVAEVTTTIPAGGLGEVTFVAQGGRVTYPARSAGASPVLRGTPVTISDFTGTVVTVGPKK